MIWTNFGHEPQFWSGETKEWGGTETHWDTRHYNRSSIIYWWRIRIKFEEFNTSRTMQVRVLTSWGCRSTLYPKKRTSRPRPWLPWSPGELLSNSPTATSSTPRNEMVDKNKRHPKKSAIGERGQRIFSEIEDTDQETTLHLSSLVFGGDPSRAIFRASTGFALHSTPLSLPRVPGATQIEANERDGRDGRRTVSAASRSCGTCARSWRWWPQRCPPPPARPPPPPSAPPQPTLSPTAAETADDAGNKLRSPPGSRHPRPDAELPPSSAEMHTRPAQTR